MSLSCYWSSERRRWGSPSLSTHLVKLWSVSVCRAVRAYESGPAKVWEIFMDRSGGAHGETALLCRQGDPTASESQGDLSGAEEAHASRGGVDHSEPKALDWKRILLISKCWFIHPCPQMQSLCSSEKAMALLDHMETQYYELQLQLYDIQAEILHCEELLLTAQLDSIRRQMTGILNCVYLLPFVQSLLTSSSDFDYRITWFK